MCSSGFAFDSNISLLNKRFNEDIFLQLSTYARISSINSASKSIPQDFSIPETDVIVDPEGVSWNQLMLIARGLISFGMLNRIREREEKIGIDK